MRGSDVTEEFLPQRMRSAKAAPISIEFPAE
jgi:hypothetical protein